METVYVAYGLALRCSFPLPGMAPRKAEGLPSLTLNLARRGELEAAWSGGDGSAWHGRLGDGQRLSIAPGPGEDLLFTYGERALFRLDRAAGVLECAPRDLSELDWQRVLLGRVLPNVSLAYGREALHAGAVESPHGVVALAAPSGTGKSTLATELVRRGWPLCSDDVLVLETAGGEVLAHPGTPHVTLAEGVAWPEPSGATLGVLAGERWVAIRDAQTRPTRLAAIFLFDRAADLSLAVRPLRSSPLTLAPYMLGLPDEAARESARFGLYSDLATSTALLRLTAGATDSPAALADAVGQALDGSLLAGGVA
ncbi:MAG TPA: hypothetical protein VF085_08785 [Solirubrobacterales bacterium]